MVYPLDMKRPIFARPFSDAERETLKAGLRSPDAFTLRRCQILLASADEKKNAYQIARELGCHDQTARNAIHELNEGGLEVALARGSSQPHVVHRAFWTAIVVATVLMVVSGCAQNTDVPPSAGRTSSSGPGEPTVAQEITGEQSVMEGGCGSGAVCAPPSNSTPVPDVVGMRVEEACRTLLREDFLGYVYGKRDDEGSSTRPGRVVAQKPRAGKVLDPQGAFLFVAKPFPDVLPRGTHCAQREVGSPG